MPNVFLEDIVRTQQSAIPAVLRLYIRILQTWIALTVLECQFQEESRPFASGRISE